MSLTNFLIPFGLPPAEHANDLVKLLAAECGTDGLAMLLSRYQSLTRTQFDDFSPELPHEVWQNEKFKAEHSSLLQHYANSFKVDLNPGHWFLLTPVHLHIARNHLVLTDYRQLALSEQDALLLFEKAKALCAEAGVEIVFGNATTWFLRADEWNDFETSTPDAACGHNIEIWSAKGSKELAWRKLQNEIQMEWFTHPLQQQREERGEKVINGLWLWSGTTLPTGFAPSPVDGRGLGRGSLKTSTLSTFLHDLPPSPPPTLQKPFGLRKLPLQGQFVPQAQCMHCETPATPHKWERGENLPARQVLDQLSSAALSNDWGTWAALMIELERNCFKPLCAALKKREITQLQIHLSNSKTLLSIQTSSNALKKFWRFPTFKNLIT
jgi:hypothetical protein